MQRIKENGKIEIKKKGKFNSGKNVKQWEKKLFPDMRY